MAPSSRVTIPFIAFMTSPAPVALSLAAQDPLGGAGTAADLTTFAALGVHGTIVVTALTAQSAGGVHRVVSTDAGFVGEQIEGILADFAPAAMKTGLMTDAEVVHMVAALVDTGRLPAPVVDPVLVDGRGGRIIDHDIENAYRSELVPQAAVITPNLREAEILLGRSLGSIGEVVESATELNELGADWVVVTGGHWDHASDVVIGPDGFVEIMRAPPVDTRHVRGSGCTFAAAITAGLAKGDHHLEAIVTAHRFVRRQLSHTPAWRSASGAGPVAHW